MPAKINNTEYKLVVKKSSAGFGLFADEDIPKDVYIIEYCGPILTNAQANEKGGKYLFKINTRKTIDGSGRQNTARYINHSCKPNCDAVIDGSRIFIESRRKIKKGEEITYHYGKEYVDDYIKPMGCKCSHCLTKSSK